MEGRRPRALYLTDDRKHVSCMAIGRGLETVLGGTLCAVKMRAPLVKLFAGNARTAPVPVRGLMTRWQTSVCGKPKPEGVALALFIETVLLSLQRGRRIGGNNS